MAILPEAILYRLRWLTQDILNTCIQAQASPVSSSLSRNALDRSSTLWIY